MAKKGKMPVFETVDDYINNQPKEIQPKLNELRKLIKSAVPEAVEIRNSKVPTYLLVENSNSKQHLMFAAYKNFISFYPFEGVVSKFSNELKDYEHGKGSIKFPLDKSLPKDLITKMVKYRKEELS